MPKLKQQKWREEKAAAMRAAKKRKNLIAIESSLTDDLPSTNLVNTNSCNKKIDILPLTGCKPNRKGDVHKLQMGPREYKGGSEYMPKDSGNRLLHWDSLKKLVRSNTRCSRCGSEVTLQEKTLELRHKLDSHVQIRDVV